MKQLKSALILVMGVVCGIVFVYSCGGSGGSTATGVTTDELQAQIDELQQGLIDNATAIQVLSNTVTTLQNMTIGVYDANGQYLGALMDNYGEKLTVFNPDLSGTVQFDISPSSTTPGRVVSQGAYLYEDNTCSGNPYFSHQVGPHKVSKINDKVYISFGTSQYVNIAYRLNFSGCVSDLTGWDDVYESKEVTLPFNEPIALPIRFTP